MANRRFKSSDMAIRDLGEINSPDECLTYALHQNMEHVVILGYDDEHGFMSISSDGVTCGEALIMSKILENQIMKEIRNEY